MTEEIQVQTMAARVHGRYLVRVAEAKGPAPLLVGFHGYAENAERHLDALIPIPGITHWTVAAVQGLHPFYNVKTGEVIANWMTKQDRELAIQDNVAYVAAVLDELKRDSGREEPPLVLAGFSQGVAMAYRTAALAGHACRGLIALAGDVPPDLGERDLPGFPKVFLGRGTEDEWYNEEKMVNDVELLKSKSVEVETCVFDGGHEWTGEFYRAAGRFLEEMVG